MAIATSDPAIPIVNTQFSSLIAADLSRSIDSNTFCFEVAARPLRATSPDVPTAVWIGDNMM